MLGRLRGKTAFRRSWDAFTLANTTLATNETIFSAVTMLAGALASAPLAVRRDYKKLTPGEHPAARLLEYGFNPWMSSFEFIRALETLRDLTGAGYALKEYSQNGQLTALWLLKTECVEPAVEEDSRELYYRISGDGAFTYLHHAHVVAVRHISGDGLHPVSPVRVLENTLTYDREVKEFSVNQMRSGLHASVVMKVSGNIQPEEMKAYNDAFRKFRSSGVLYLDAGKELTELKNQSSIDPKVFEVENITVARVARVYNIPLGKLLPEKIGYASSEQGDLGYLRDTILPIARMYEQELSRQLLTEQERDGGLQIKLSLNGFARADMGTRGEFYFKGIRSSWFCANEIRGLEDMPPVPGGDVFYVSRDLVPIGQEGEQQHERDTGDPESGPGAGGSVAG